MDFDHPVSPERKAPKLTEDEYLKIINREPDDPVLIEWMKVNGIEYDSGVVLLEIDGESVRVHTSRDDFGTKVLAEEELKRIHAVGKTSLEEVIEEIDERRMQNERGGYRRRKAPSE